MKFRFHPLKPFDKFSILKELLFGSLSTSSSIPTAAPASSVLVELKNIILYLASIHTFNLYSIFATHPVRQVNCNPARATLRNALDLARYCQPAINVSIKTFSEKFISIMSVGFAGCLASPCNWCLLRVAPEGSYQVVIYSIGVTFMLLTPRLQPAVSDANTFFVLPQPMAIERINWNFITPFALQN